MDTLNNVTFNALCLLDLNRLIITHLSFAQFQMYFIDMGGISNSSYEFRTEIK